LPQATVLRRAARPPFLISRESELVEGVTQETKEKTVSKEGLSHLFVVYAVWSSTYLAIRVAVLGPSGFPPFILGATRLLAACFVLFLLATLRHENLRLPRGQLAVLAASGILMWVSGNGLVNWAEQDAPSGFAALMLASTPIWVAAIQAATGRERPSLLFTVSLLVGFAGVGVLTIPSFTGGTSVGLASSLALLLAALSWGSGSILQSRLLGETAPMVSSGYQQLFGAAGLAVAILLTGEGVPAPSSAALLAWGYLVIFGSVLAFTSYVRALRLLPTSIAMTYAYVNPILAVLLGAVLLGEQVTAWTLLGAALIVMGVAGVFRSRRKAQARNEGDELH
jgi:drug/metabolite transporter (DMT)-like permease